MSKWNSRKLWITLLSGVAGVLYPPALPLITMLAPKYIIGQSAVDVATAIGQGVAAYRQAKVATAEPAPAAPVAVADKAPA